MEEINSADPDNLEGTIEALVKHDQLNCSKSTHKWLDNFHEMPITFLPTYRFDAHSSTYDTSEK